MKQATLVPPNELNIAVLFLVFNRLDTTEKVFESIQRAKPSRLYIAADGARKNKINEVKVVEKVRHYVTSNINWDCEVFTLFREENLGCGLAVSTAISWFFENEEMGIILEDDCLANQSFFWFCENLLNRYKNDMRVGQISGDNFQDGKKRGNSDYYFSIYNHIWGWATWANRWKFYDITLDSIEDETFIDIVFSEGKTRMFWKDIFHIMKNDPIDTWDYQWCFSLWNKQLLTILPNVNLIQNIGFGPEATHTKVDCELANLSAYDLTLTNHPTDVKRDYAADIYTFKKLYASKTIVARVLSKLKRIFS